MLEVNSRIQIPDSEFTFAYSRSGGPGGQNVNKVCSKALMTWDVTQSPSIPQDVRERFLLLYRRRITKEGLLLITSQRYRDQGRNSQDCLNKLAELLLSVAVTPTKRSPQCHLVEPNSVVCRISMCVPTKSNHAAAPIWAIETVWRFNAAKLTNNSAFHEP